MRYARKEHWKDEAIELGYGFLPTKQPKEPSFDRSGYQTDLDDARRVYRDEGRRSRPRRDSDRPPHSNTGGKLTEPNTGPRISIDWLRMSGPRSQRHEALNLLQAYLGSATYGKGRHFLNAGYRFGAGGVYFDADEELRYDHCIVDLPATLCAEFTIDQLRNAMTELLMLGFKITRVDVALDIFTMSDLIDNVYQSCMNGELCRARRFEPKYEQSGASVTAHGCNIGRRGKDGSGRYLRVYDKGLETKQSEQGTWIRWEAELSDGPGQDFAMSFVKNADYVQTAIEFALGVCDFRENTGDDHIDRRPRSAWYQALLDEIEPARTVKERVQSTVYTFKKWMETAVLPRLKTLAAASGKTLGSVTDQLFEEVHPDPEHLEDQKVRTLCLELGVDPSDAMHRLGNARLVLLTASPVGARGAY